MVQKCEKTKFRDEKTLFGPTFLSSKRRVEVKSRIMSARPFLAVAPASTLQGFSLAGFFSGGDCA